MSNDVDMALSDLLTSQQLLTTAVCALIKAAPNKDILRTTFTEMDDAVSSHIRGLVASGGLPNTKNVLTLLDRCLGN